MGPNRTNLLALVLVLQACGGSGEDATPSVDAGLRTTTPAPHGLPTFAAPPAPTRVPTTPLEVLQLGAVGRWIGQASLTASPSTYRKLPASWSLWLDLHEDGHYSAGCIDADCYAAFHEGNDGEWPKKSYAIYDLVAGSTTAGVGELMILLGGDGTAEATLRRADLNDIHLSDDRNTMTFVLETGGGGLDHALVHYELHRAER
jgi:hypothetical protein